MSPLLQQIFFWSALGYWIAGFFLIWKIQGLSGLTGPVGGSKSGDVSELTRRGNKLFTTADISVVIPARNEAGNIETLLESLLVQHSLPHEIIVVDDRSEDGTGDIAEGYAAGFAAGSAARSAKVRADGVAVAPHASRADTAAASRLRVIRPKEHPEGWTGKNWSCHSGAREAEAPLLLFLDSDTRLSSPDALEKLAAAYNRRGGLLSLQPYHRVKKIYEQLSGFFNMIVMVGSNSFSIWSRPGRADGCFGPCILTSREDYRRIGGHEAVREQVVDDLALCGLYRRTGLPVYNFGGWGVIDFRMYPDGLRSLVEGWTKNMAVGATLADLRAIFLLIIWFTGISNAILAVGSIGGSFEPVLGPAIIGVYALYAGQIYLQLRRVGSFNPAAAVFFPVLFLFFVGIFIFSIVRIKIYRSVTWKGRSIRVE